MLFEAISFIRGNNSSVKPPPADNELLTQNSIPVTDPQKSDFYCKLEVLNEKIKLFKDVFYDSKRDDEKRKVFEAKREKHRQMVKNQDMVAKIKHKKMTSNNAQSLDLRKH